MRSFKLFLCLFAVVPFFMSCNDDDDASKGLDFDKNKVQIVAGKSDKVTIKSGPNTYTATSSDTKTATASISNKEITIKGVKIGNAVISVKDKSGKLGKIAVTVIKDPNESAKADSKTRFVWDKISKIQGTDKGTYKLAQAKDGKVEFSWKSEDAKKTIVLTFPDKVGSVTEGIKKNAKLQSDGKDIKISSLEVIQNKIVKQGEKATIWMTFTADNKKGVCVGQLSE